MKMTLLKTPGLVAGVALLTVIAYAGDAATVHHPHFDDQGTLSWTTTLVEAQKAAKRDNRLILVEYGREH